MRRALAVLGAAALAACVPTTRYTYVPVTAANFDAAQNGEAIPLVAQSTALCFADGRTAYLRDARWTQDGICGDEQGRVCHAWDELAGIGIPYESRSLSVVPMAEAKIGSCDPVALARQVE